MTAIIGTFHLRESSKSAYLPFTPFIFTFTTLEIELLGCFYIQYHYYRYYISLIILIFMCFFL